MNTLEAPAQLMEPDEPPVLSQNAFQILVIAFALTEAALGAAVFHGWIWLAVPLVLLAAHLMHGMLIGYHEASHGHLRKSRRLNEFDGILIGVFSLLPFSLFRWVHQTHHAYMTTERDEEFWPFVRPGTPRGLRILAAVLELTIGFIYSPCIFLRAFLSPNSPIRSRKVRRRIWAELALTVVVWIALLTTVAHFNLWKYFLWMHLAPAWLAANMQSWRKFVEHMGLTGTTVNSATRSVVGTNWFGRFMAFTLLNEPMHGVHHQQAGIPQASVPRHVAKLTPVAEDDIPPFPSYWSATLHMIRSLGDPRIGAQWRRVARREERELANVN